LTKGPLVVGQRGMGVAKAYWGLEELGDRAGGLLVKVGGLLSRLGEGGKGRLRCAMPRT